ncbi:FMN-dependent NADH-azoreductase [Deinococcus aquaedulcis]|uniref:FMN-dependent NADH-azoreductase n=1 Tax=Deinococcus aquaedulcis TaxID=2840455 RepID=UPI001C83D4A2|nr:NAD(P)H-dependent oxidoreductase [Deinococcus aquaedulcis]
MTKVLFVQGNPKPLAESTSRQLGQHFVEAYVAAHPGAQVTALDLYSAEIPFIDADVMTGWGKLARQEDLLPHEAQKVARLGELVDQFLDTDLLVFAAPMWNFGYPPMVKAYMDAVAVAGKTFRYGPQGPIGLATGKQAVILETRGGFWSAPEASAMEHSASHLRAFLGFLGVTDVETVFAEGLNFDPGRSEEIMAEAAERARALAQQLAAKALQPA